MDSASVRLVFPVPMDRRYRDRRFAEHVRFRWQGRQTPKTAQILLTALNLSCSFSWWHNLKRRRAHPGTDFVEKVNRLDSQDCRAVRIGLSWWGVEFKRNTEHSRERC